MRPLSRRNKPRTDVQVRLVHISLLADSASQLRTGAALAEQNPTSCSGHPSTQVSEASKSCRAYHIYIERHMRFTKTINGVLGTEKSTVISWPLSRRHWCSSEGIEGPFYSLWCSSCRWLPARQCLHGKHSSCLPGVVLGLQARAVAPFKPVS